MGFLGPETAALEPQLGPLTAAPEALYQLHDSGAIWRYTGTPCGAGG